VLPQQFSIPTKMTGAEEKLFNLGKSFGSCSRFPIFRCVFYFFGAFLAPFFFDKMKYLNVGEKTENRG